MTRKATRRGFLVAIFILGLLFAVFGEGFSLHMIPGTVIGYLFIAVAVLGAFGVNIWYGGPLDPRADGAENRKGLTGASREPRTEQHLSNAIPEKDKKFTPLAEIEEQFPRATPHPLYRIMGIAAWLNEVMRRHNHGGITGDDLLIVVSVLLTGCGIIMLVNVVPLGTLSLIQFSAIVTAVASLLFSFSVWLKVQRNIIFQPDARQYPNVSSDGTFLVFSYSGYLWCNRKIKAMYLRQLASMRVDRESGDYIVATRICSDTRFGEAAFERSFADWLQTFRPGKISGIDTGW